MKHRYYVKGMTCDSCKEKITRVWMNISGIRDVSFVDNHRVDVTMDVHISVDVLQEALAPLESYTVSSDPLKSLPSWVSGLWAYK
jgi:copper chaperone CopZ